MGLQKEMWVRRDVRCELVASAAAPASASSTPVSAKSHEAFETTPAVAEDEIDDLNFRITILKDLIDEIEADHPLRLSKPAANSLREQLKKEIDLESLD